MELIRGLWSRSGWYRLALSLALLYLLVRTAGHVYYLFVVRPLDMGSFQGVFVPNDLKDYLEAAQRFSQRADLYLSGPLDRVEFYQYSPAYALLLTPLLSIHPTITVILSTILHLAAYIALYIAWGRIFRWIGLARGGEMLAWSLPLWLVFEPLWSDLSYLNIYLLVALLATWLTDSILHQDLPGSVLCTVILLQVKPFWAFAAGVPLLLGSRKFFWKMLAGSLAGYFLLAGITLLAAGPEYGLQQYSEYFHFLANMSTNFPWRGPEQPFLGYNHSIMQVVLYLLGISPGNMLVARLIKYALLLPLAGLGLWHLTRPVQAEAGSQYKLEMALGLYVGAFVFLDVFWEISLGLAVFAYLLAAAEYRLERIVACVAFIPYCLMDVWRFLSYLIWGMDALSGAYILADPSAYLPLILFALLAFYGLLLRRLFRRVQFTKPA